MGKPTRKYVSPLPSCIGVLTMGRFVDFAMHRVRMLQHFGVIPFLIFDGDYLPSKAATEADRAKRREKSKRAGQELLNAGKASQAYLEFQKAVDVTPEMARLLIDELKQNGVQYIVAPYEADAQLVYLERKGIIDGILSEDSDLLVFGAKCLLTKLDQYGNCIEINKADFCACKEINLAGWSDTEFRCMAILSGCDYLSSITNMGLKTAYRMVRRHKTIEKVIRMLQFDGKFLVPKGYLEAFYQAELTFLYQRVFCPKKLTLVFHTEPPHPIDEDKMLFIGAYFKPEIAQGVARGDLNPMTKLPIVVETKAKMAVPTRPWAASRAQPQRSASSNDLKKGKPINTFFKPKRIPLAELDINCFTPSPTQQDALLRNTGPWLASPAPRQYLHRAATDSVEPPQSAPTAAQIHTGRAHIRTSTVSEPRPPKRARLCADIETGDSPSQGQKVELGRSRFFVSAAPEPSPTIGKTFRGKMSKKQDITIFSDDSVEDIMRDLPDFDGFTNQVGRKGTRIAVFEEEQPKTSENPNANFYPLTEPAAAGHVATSQDATPDLAPPLFEDSSAEAPPTPSEHTSLPTAAEKLKLDFSFVPAGTSTPKSNIAVHGLPTPSSSASFKASRIPLAVKSNASIETIQATTKTSSLTPLQRLGSTAMNRSRLLMTPPLTPLVTPKNKSNQPRLSQLSKGIMPFLEVAQTNKAAEVEPASIPLPMPDEAENIVLSMQNGSEDLIIHDSEEEGLSPGAGEEAPRINLGRFVYAG